MSDPVPTCRNARIPSDDEESPGPSRSYLGDTKGNNASLSLETTDQALRELSEGAAPESACNVQAREAGTQWWARLKSAVERECTEEVRTLLDSEADICTPVPIQQTQPTVLHLAASMGHSEILGLLLAHTGVLTMLNTQNSNKETPLFEAIASRNVRCVTSLLKAGADVTVMSKRGTVLHRATVDNQLSIVKALFEHSRAGMDTIKDDAYFKPPGMEQATALHLAAHAGYLDIVHVLLNNGCDKRAKMIFYKNHDFTALHLAVYINQIEVVDVLLRSDPSLVDDVSTDGWTPMHIACAFGFEACARRLMSAEPNLSARIKRADGTSSSTMEFLLARMPFSVDFLKKTFDLSIAYQATDTKVEGLSRCIDVNYAVLSPRRSDDFQPMHVIDSLLQTGEHLNQHSLFLHPLVQSYLHLRWKAMSAFYYVFLASYIVFTIVLSVHVIGVYYLQGTYLYPPWFTFFYRCLATTIFVVVYYEGLHTLLALPVCKVLKNCHWGGWGALAKMPAVFPVSVLKVLWTGSLIVLVYFVPNLTYWPHQVVTSSLVLFWFRLMYLISNIPHFNCAFYLLVFFEVASNFFKVLFAFSGIIGVFVAAFFLEFGTRAPFNSTSEGIVKIVVMMSSEFDYSNLFVDSDSESYAGLFRMFLFIMFVFLVAIVVMNILIAKAITDVKKIDRIRKHAEFLIRLEKEIDQHRFCLSFVKKIIRICSFPVATSSATRNIVTIRIGEDWKKGAQFPKDLRIGLLEIAHQNKRGEVSNTNR